MAQRVSLRSSVVMSPGAAPVFAAAPAAPFAMIPGGLPPPVYGDPGQMSGRRSITRVSFGGSAPPPGGMNIVNIAMPDSTNNPEHMKHKRLSASGQAYGLSSPFEFSQGDPMQQFSQVQATGGGAEIGMTQGQFAARPQQQMQYVQVQQQRPQPMMMQQQAPRPMMAAPPPQPPVEPVMEGWLSKRGPSFGSGWKTRWFVMKGNVCTYSKEQGGKPAGEFALDTATVVRPFSQPGCTVEAVSMKFQKPHGFEVFHGLANRTYYIDAGTPEKCYAWVTKMNQVIDQMRSCGGQMPGGKGGGKGGPPAPMGGYPTAGGFGGGGGYR